MSSEEKKNAGAEAAEFCPYCMSRVEPGKSCPVCKLTEGSYTPAPHHLPPGTVLGSRYLVGRVLGEGGFGITYIGCDLRLEMKVAIKEYYPADSVSRNCQASLGVVTHVGSATQNYEKGLKRFLYEARTMARMEKQPQIVMVRDFFEANNTAYIVMEYVEGTNFEDLTRQRGGRIEAEELFRLIEPLFPALSAVHAAGLIHRDISPDNLMLEHGSVRLLDFGCARESLRGTETMTIALKQGYAPIEQYQRRGQGPWTDVYALSATIYYCLTGRVPPQALDRLLGDELVPPRELGVKLTPGQQKALLRGMAIQPRQRYQSVEELYAGLYNPVEPWEDPNLSDLIVRRGGRIAPQELLRLMAPVFAELEELHAAGSAQLGITPGALVLKSKELHLREQAKAALRSEGYAAPEQYSPDGRPGKAADIYALSACIYYGLTGQTPPGAAERVRQDRLIAPIELGVELSEEKQEALLRGLALAPEQRWQSAEELREALTAEERSEIEEDEDENENESVNENENVNDNTRVVTEDYGGRTEPDAGSKKLYIAIATAAAAIVLILALVLIPSGEEPAHEAPLPGVSSELPEDIPDSDELFMNAVTVTSYDELQNALADAAVPAVSCKGAISVDDTAQLRLNKPVYVPEGSAISSTGTIVVGEGAALWIDGEAHGDSSGSFAAILTDGGELISGETANISSSVWYAPGSFTMLGERGSLGEIYALPDESVFENAAVVTDSEGYAAALGDASVSAVAVDGPVVVSGTITADKPVLVTENGSFSLPEGYDGEAFDLQFTAGLVNNGSISCGVWFDGCAMLNRGTLVPAHGLWAGHQYTAGMAEDRDDASLVNLGSVELRAYSVIWCDALNLGSIVNLSPDGFNTDGGALINCGSIENGLGASMMMGGSLLNTGTLVNNGHFQNLGLIVHRVGSITTNGELVNYGLIDMYDGPGSIEVGSFGSFETQEGVALSRDPAGREASAGKVWRADFRVIDDAGAQGRRTVTNERELMAALADPAVSVVDVTGAVELSDSLTLTKSIYVYGEGALKLPRDAVLIVDGVTAAINGGLIADKVDVANGGMLEIIAPWEHYGEGASLAVYGGSWFYSRDCALELESCTVSSNSMAVLAAYDGELSLKNAEASGALALGSGGIDGVFDAWTVSDGLMVQLGTVASGSGSIVVGGGSYNQLGELGLESGGVENDGVFLTTSSELHIGEGASFTNNGELRQLSFTDNTIVMAGEFTDNGSISHG